MNKIIDKIHIPKDVTMKLPLIRLLGNQELYIENYRGILEYTEKLIRIQTKFGKIIETFEQIGRYSCFACMIFNIPGTYFGFTSKLSFVIYLIVNFVLIFAYCIIWIFCFNKNNLFKSISLSVFPSVVFFLSGILSHSVLLTIGAIIFAPCHILISVKSCKMN